jgi:hypothetical protein
MVPDVRWIVHTSTPRAEPGGCPPARRRNRTVFLVCRPSRDTTIVSPRASNWRARATHRRRDRRSWQQVDGGQDHDPPPLNMRPRESDPSPGRGALTAAAYHSRRIAACRSTAEARGRLPSCWNPGWITSDHLAGSPCTGAGRSFVRRPDRHAVHEPIRDGGLRTRVRGRVARAWGRHPRRCRTSVSGKRFHNEE